jgi:release factor glutamine methyltransferase
MRKYFKYLVSIILIPLTKWYLKKNRKFTFGDISIVVWPGVFHPGFFSSTKFLLSYIADNDLENKKVLELGCGTGLISIYAAKHNAQVTASDVSVRAIENCSVNALKNNAEVNVVVSDLFDAITPQHFDWILINPPYYAKEVGNEAEFAWHCGKDFAYFKKLFRQLSSYATEGSRIVMVLTKGCNVKAITSIALQNGHTLCLIREKKVLFDGKDYLFEIVLRPSSSLADQV